MWRLDLKGVFGKITLTLATMMIATVAAAAPEALDLNSPWNEKFNVTFFEFFDPSNSGISAPLTYLWNREIYQSISDLKGAELTRVLRDQYFKETSEMPGPSTENHDFAERVAKRTNARATIWGVLAELDGTEITLAASLTVPSAKESIFPGFTRLGSWREWPTAPHANALVYSPEIAIDRVNFAPTSLALSALYGEQAMVRCSLDRGCAPGTPSFYPEPRAKGGIPARLGEKVLVDFSDPHRRPTGKFLPIIRKSDGTKGWMYTSFLDFQPQEVFVPDGHSIELQDSVGIGGGAAPRLLGPLFLPVLDSAITGPVHVSSRWYQVKTPQNTIKWVNRADVREVWAANHINFIAGMYRYALGKYASAYDEFDIFRRRANKQEENVATSLAYQFMAASLLAKSANVSSASREAAINLLSESIKETPFDDRPLYLRAFTRFGWNKAGGLAADETELAKSDLRSAQMLLAGLHQQTSNSTNLELLSLAISAPNLYDELRRAAVFTPKCGSSKGPVVVQSEHGEYTAAVLRSLAVSSNCFTVMSADAAKGSTPIAYFDLVPGTQNADEGGYARTLLTLSNSERPVAHASSVLNIVDTPDPTKADEVELLKGYALAYSKLVKNLDAVKDIKPSRDDNDAKPEKP